jgi:ankyrin repeat protein
VFDFTHPHPPQYEDPSYTALMHLASHGGYESSAIIASLARVLLCHGASPNVQTCSGETALDVALIADDDCAMVRLLQNWPRLQSFFVLRSARQVPRLSRAAPLRNLPEGLCRMIASHFF